MSDKILNYQKLFIETKSLKISQTTLDSTQKKLQLMTQQHKHFRRWTYAQVFQFVLGDLELVHQLGNGDSWWAGRLLQSGLKLNFVQPQLNHLKKLPHLASAWTSFLLLRVHVQVHLIRLVLLRAQLLLECFQLSFQLTDSFLSLRWHPRKQQRRSQMLDISHRTRES